MTKTMCKKNLEKREKELAKEPVYKCKKCKSTAHKKKYLCKPKKVEKSQNK